jgi:hypothetical protein
MFEAIKEIGETVREAGFDLATRALTGMMGLVREVAGQFEEKTGVSLPFSGLIGYDAQTRSSPAGHFPSPRTEPPFGSPAPAPTRRPTELDWAATERPTPRSEPSTPDLAHPEPQKKKRSSKSTPKKSSSKSKKGKKKSAKGKRKKGRARKNQLYRVLKLLEDSNKQWMSASELSDASAERDTRILPGNVRKVIRTRGKSYIESRPRAESRRGALEFRINEEGRKHLEEM